MNKNFLEDSWVYQEILREGREKGVSQGEQRALLAIIQKRFPEIMPFVRQMIGGVTDPLLLEGLIGDVSIAQTAQEALEILSVLKSNGQMHDGQGEDGLNKPVGL